MGLKGFGVLVLRFEPRATSMLSTCCTTEPQPTGTLESFSLTPETFSLDFFFDSSIYITTSLELYVRYSVQTECMCFLFFTLFSVFAKPRGSVFGLREANKDKIGRKFAECARFQ